MTDTEDFNCVFENRRKEVIENFDCVFELEIKEYLFMKNLCPLSLVGNSYVSIQQPGGKHTLVHNRVEIFSVQPRLDMVHKQISYGVVRYYQ